MFYNCTKSGDMDFEYSVPFDDIQDSISLTEIIDSVKYIKLETTDKCRIGNVRQTIINNDKIYILSDGVFCFDRKGKFIFSINQKGHSNSEFIEINNINIVDDTLYLYDNISNKVLTFDSNNGKYISNTKFSNGVSAAYGLNDMFLIDCHSMPYNKGKNDGRFLIFSQDNINEAKESYFSASEYKLIVDGTTSVNDNGIFFTSFLGLKAWKISSKGCIPFMKINIPEELKLSKSIIERSTKEQVLPSVEPTAKKIYGLSNVYETVNHIVGRLCYENVFVYFIYSKNNEKTIFYKSIADTEPWQSLPLDFSSSDGICLYKVISSDDISLIRSLCGTGNKPVGIDSLNYEKFCATNDNDNPIVTQFFLKK